MNLENLNLVELNAQEVQEFEGGNFAYALTIIGMCGAGAAWVFDKGEAYGKYLAGK
ncbi:hypothetical protein QWY99_21005 [Flavobacterium branchiarum]|uniref:Class IIb bacteriocin, lactobin A/cerein 7B family n=1 Tax=Flavobacterium branchiarum TaxID=1114870 RepID=A0ABV5FPM3_9FLAO|nr:hypothetical protein [Flavobacterium branchiarum]MDN3675515.1 hypothetical protein [Flavobacterium branchiarum]